MALPIVYGAAPSIRSGMEVIDKCSVNAALVVNNDMTLLGVATDGDLRRALLRGASIEDSLIPFMTANPVTAQANESRSAVLDLMMSRSIDQVPVLDSAGRVLGLHTLRQLLGRESKRNSTLILAGGRGTRLGRETRRVPKPMLRVAGRPILERLINHCVGFGFTNITLSVAYLADDIIAYFGDGDHFGCQIRYLHDRESEPRGTGGPFVDFVRSRPNCDDTILVINGDLVTDANLSSLVDGHDDAGALMTIATYDYVHEVPFGVVEADASGFICRVEEKPLLSVPVSAGIYALSPEAAHGLPDKGPIPMTEIVRKLLAQRSKVLAFPITTDWLDVGSPSDLRKARGALQDN